MTNPVIEALMKHLVPILEEELVKHEPELQSALLEEAKALLVQIDEWIASKIKAKEQ